MSTVQESAASRRPLAIAVLGASGDLARKKLYPALFSLYCQGFLPPNFRVYGFARTRMTEELFGPAMEVFDPEQVAPVAAYFCSEECAVSGEVWSVAGGNIGRFFVGRAVGYTKHPEREGALTPEDVAAHVDEIRDQAGYAVLDTLQDELKLILPKLM